MHVWVEATRSTRFLNTGPGTVQYDANGDLDRISIRNGARLTLDYTGSADDRKATLVALIQDAPAPTRVPGWFAEVAPTCVACRWDRWQSDAMQALGRTGLGTYTGNYIEGQVWTDPAGSVYVGPFADGDAVKGNIQRVHDVVKAVAIAHNQTDFDLAVIGPNQPKEYIRSEH